jgi:NAD(P)-dependent dehydrogenase (short-subunit alcohol dehydrogenase family)
LRRRRGVVVNVGSDSGVLGFSGGAAYCASKGAIAGLTRALAVELAPDVRTICIAPGPVETDMMEASVARAPDRDAALRQWADYTHLRRVAKPEEIGEVIAFAASDRASFATGAVWMLDGGVTAGKRI